LIGNTLPFVFELETLVTLMEAEFRGERRERKETAKASGVDLIV